MVGIKRVVFIFIMQNAFDIVCIDVVTWQHVEYCGGGLVSTYLWQVTHVNDVKEVYVFIFHGKYSFDHYYDRLDF